MKEGQSAERRHSETDLELGRAHMLEILEKILPMVNRDEEKNREYNLLIKDLKNVQNSLDLKKIYNQTRRRLEDLDIGGSGGSRPEDTKEIHRLLIQLDNLPIELFK